MAETQSESPIIRIDNYLSERYDTIKVMRARDEYLRTNVDLTMHNFFTSKGRKAHKIQFHEIKKNGVIWSGL